MSQKKQMMGRESNFKPIRCIADNRYKTPPRKKRHLNYIDNNTFWLYYLTNPSVLHEHSELLHDAINTCLHSELLHDEHNAYSS